jgi:hypothetical protein
MTKKFVGFLLSFLILNHAWAEMVCGEDNQSGEFQTCSVQQSQDPDQCETPKDPIIENTGVEMKAMSCDNDSIGGLSKKSTKEKNEIKEEYKKQCKAKAKAYKKALMGNLLKKGKIGQLVQVLFKKKKYKAKTDAAFRMESKIDANHFESMSDQEIENQ